MLVNYKLLQPNFSEASEPKVPISEPTEPELPFSDHTDLESHYSKPGEPGQYFFLERTESGQHF